MTPDDTSHDDDRDEQCDNCGDPLDDSHQVELEFPTDHDGAPGYVAGQICGGCAGELSDAVVADHAEPVGLDNIYSQLGIDTSPSPSPAPDGGDDRVEESSDTEPSTADSERALEGILQAIDHLETFLAENATERRELDQALAALEEVDVDGVDEEIRRRVAKARGKISGFEPVAPDEYGTVASLALAQLAPLAARAAREWRDRPPSPGSVTLQEEPESTAIDVDLEAAERPVAELQKVIGDAETPPWTLQVFVELDPETADRYAPAFEALVDDPDRELYNFLYNYGATDMDVSIHGYSPEYYFRERSAGP